MNCTPIGGYRREYGKLSTAEFQFFIGRPDDRVLAEDYDKAVENLSKIQGGIATGTDRKNLLAIEGKTKNIRLSANVFELRVKHTKLYCAFPLMSRTGHPPS